jgi:hypothetical protein
MDNHGGLRDTFLDNRSLLQARIIPGIDTGFGAIDFVLFRKCFGGSSCCCLVNRFETDSKRTSASPG